MTLTEQWSLQTLLATYQPCLLTAYQLRLVADYHAKRWVGFVALDGAHSDRADRARVALSAVLDEFQKRSVDLDRWIPASER